MEVFIAFPPEKFRDEELLIPAKIGGQGDMSSYLHTSESSWA